MAEQSQNPGAVTNSFTKGMVKDFNDTFIGEGLWSHARNAVNNSHDGQVGVIGNEPANLHCVTLPYDLIGAIHITDDEWAIYTTDDVNSEIGIFDESKCTYTKVINDPCLNFKRSNLITGISRKRYDCQRPVYWADGLNPDRFMDLGNVPYKCKKKLIGSAEEAPQVYSYVVSNTSTPSIHITGTLKQACSDQNCTQQGDTTLTFTLSQPAPTGGLTLLIGNIRRYSNENKVGVGMNIFTLPAGVTADTHYDDPNIPFEVVIPAGATSFTTAGLIRQQGTPLSCNDCSMICHNCLFPITDFYIKSNTAGVTVALTAVQNVNVINVDVPNSSSQDAITFTYLDIDDVTTGPITVVPGQSKTVCAQDGSVVVSNPQKAIVSKGVSCIQVVTEENTCYALECTDQLDCEKLRLAPLVTHPCISLSKGRGAGTLPNGSYQVAIAYTINQVRVTDYIGLTEVQALFDHDNVGTSLEVDITSIDANFDEFELVLVAQINAQTIARRIGYYSTSQGTIYIDSLSNEMVSVPIADIVVRTEPIEKSDAMYQVNGYGLRLGVYTKTKINYQQQANKIRAKWVAVEYPADYYIKGGNNPSFMKDEQYAFFIRWIYNTGDRSESYHIPGRAALQSDRVNVYGSDAFETAEGLQRQAWQVQNTGSVDSRTSYLLSDGGRVMASGQMGYWESSERYPDNKPEVWGDLCGEPIRHHKFPDETVDTSSQNRVLDNFTQDGQNIVILGVQFDNITHPLDINGNPIASVVGYEILRGSRQGNKSILAKGMFNNMRSYTVPGNSGQQGLYQNYPYNDLRADSYLTADFQSGENGDADPKSSKLTGFKKNIFSFHSPETTFTNPFIDASEIKVYQELSGKALGRFVTPYKHPKFKLPTDFADKITEILGVLKTIADVVGAVAGGDTVINLQGDQDIPFTQSLSTAHRAESPMMQFTGPAGYGYSSTTGVPELGPLGAAGKRSLSNSLITGANAAVIIAFGTVRADITAEQFFKLILALVPYRQYAAQYISHGFYNKAVVAANGNRRRKIVNTSFVNADVQTFSTKYQLNNLNRGRFVAVEVPETTELQVPTVQDNSRFVISEKNASLNVNIPSDISGYYGSLKIPMVAQYGQLESIKQLPISNCISPTIPDKSKQFTSEIIFGGDVYINRFTEKNTMLFFNNWLMGEPNGAELDYTLYFSLPYARHWVNNTNLSGGLFNSASNFRVLDYRDSAGFHIKRGYFYLFNSGVRDFFVESEVNLAYRDWQDTPAKRHYDPYSYSELSLLFRSDIIKEANYYRYDYSLSIGKLFNSQTTWGNILGRDFDPQKAVTCYSYYPDRVIYSLPQQQESKKDNWRVYLANNYKEFPSPVTSVKAVNKTGALFMMKRQSPLQFMGVEELKLDGTGAKITIGDGALFSGPQQLQAIVNADESYEYGSCQNRLATLNCTHGVFWVSQNQGKVFQYAGGLKEISRDGMKWWFAKYLPSELLKAYPDYPHADNPVKGVGVQMIYDNTNEVVYITKKDYKPKFTDYLYDAGGFYRLVGSVKTYYAFNNTAGWEDASWTISYDPKSQTWLSFHDWKPTYLIPAKNHFMSVDSDSIWKHNIRCDLFCNYYGVDYPFEVEFVSATGQTVNSLRNIEYLLEAYKYHNGCSDKFHVLDQNFDQAMVYNSEQVSGILELTLKDKSNPFAMLSYPQIQPQSIKILFSKEEQKYRFNQFWDITKNRGEFTSTNIPMFNTQANGYEYPINPAYVNYQKPALERKKFRHNVNRVFLRKFKSDNVKLLFKISNQKLLQSPR